MRHIPVELCYGSGYIHSGGNVMYILRRQAMEEDSTMQFFTNLDRKGIEAKLREAHAIAKRGF